MGGKNFLSRRRVLAGVAATLGGMAGIGFASSMSSRGVVADPVGIPRGLPEPPTDTMTYRINPKSGDKISLLGFGCMRYPVMPGETSPRSPNIDENAAFALVDYALAHGVNYFDTAWGYHGGASETLTGRALKRHPRERFYLATKMPSYVNPTLGQAREIFFTQLKKCQVDYFDCFVAHHKQLQCVFMRGDGGILREITRDYPAFSRQKMEMDERQDAAACGLWKAGRETGGLRSVRRPFGPRRPDAILLCGRRLTGAWRSDARPRGR